MKKTGRLFAAAVLAGMMTLTLTGCGSFGNKADRGNAAAETVYDDGYWAAEEAGAYDYDYVEEDMPLESAASEGSGGLMKAQRQTDDKLIYTGSIHLQTLEYEKTLDSIHKKITDAGGFIQWEDETDGNDTWYYSGSSRAANRYAQIQARIPSDGFEGFMDALQDDGQVMSRHVNVDNITQTYAETEASIKAYEIEQERLLEMMDKAETIEDMIAVEARLSEVENTLSVYKTSLASMDKDVQYSTITISVDEVREYTEEHDDSTFLSRLKETVKDSWSGFLSFLEGFLHFIIYLIPFAVLILVIVLIVRTVRKKLDEKRPERRARKQEQKLRKRQLKQQQKEQKAQFRQQQKMAKYQQKAGDKDEQGTGKDV